MDQLVQIKRRTKPHDVLLVVDAMTGQDAVNVAEQFAEATEFDGVVMTKLDGDARGGAALSRQGGDRQADPLRLDRREARAAREVPSRPDGAADPRDGRRALADREGREGDGRLRGRGAGAQDAPGPVHARRLPQAAQADPQDGPADERAGDDARHGQGDEGAARAPTSTTASSIASRRSSSR